MLYLNCKQKTAFCSSFSLIERKTSVSLCSLFSICPMESNLLMLYWFTLSSISWLLTCLGFRVKRQSEFNPNHLTAASSSMNWPGMIQNPLCFLQHPVLLIQSQGGLRAGHSYLHQAMLIKHPQVRLASHWGCTLICLLITSPATEATWRVSGKGGTHLKNNGIVNPSGWPLALLSALCLCWLPSQCLHPSACLREELLKFIAALTHQLETCQAAYIFTTIFWALTPEGA